MIVQYLSICFHVIESDSFGWHDSKVLDARYFPISNLTHQADGCCRKCRTKTRCTIAAAFWIGRSPTGTARVTVDQEIGVQLQEAPVPFQRKEDCIETIDCNCLLGGWWIPA